jgi:hypothetical protein
MTANPNWPLVSTQVAFNCGFADLPVPVWTDLTSRMWSLTCSRGRQYELDQNQAGTGQLVMADHDEVLNIANPSAGLPYQSNVVPYRQALIQAQCPPAPVGSAVNLLNASTQAPGPTDPSFETSTVGSTPTWLSPAGSTAPVVGTTTPHTGSHDLGWSVANGTTVQGVSYQVPCMPGHQYTSSVYVQQASASTQSIRVTDQVVVGDNFNRTTASGLGSADFVGGAWSTAGGSASDFSTAAGTGVPPLGVASQANTTVNVARSATIGSVVDSAQLGLLAVPVVAVGGEIDVALYARYIDGNNHYLAELQFGTDQSVTLRVRKNVAGTFSTVGSTFTQAWSYSAGSQVWVRLVVNGPAIMARAWLYGSLEPSTWQISTTDTSLTAAGGVGFRSSLASTNTNTLPVTITLQTYSATGSVLGTTTTTTGSYQRLTVTWTATQPLHTVQLATSGTAVAGAVLLDDIQHEVGASASTFASSGPVIYGVHRGYVERWPSNWNYQGMYGYAQVTTVDGFAALAARKLHSAYRAAVLALRPDYYWPMGEPAGAATFADVTGRGNPSLKPRVPVYGAGAAPAAGASLGMAGDPNGFGVKFAPTTDGTFAEVEDGEILVAGTAAGTSPVTLPAKIGTSWALTASFWINAAPAPGSFTNTTPLFLPSVTGNYLPLGFFINNSGAVETDFVNFVGGSFTSVIASGAGAVLDGRPHLVVAVVTQATNTTVTTYVDGVQVSTNTKTTAAVGVLGQSSVDISVGGSANGINNGSQVNGIVAHAAVWNRALSSTELTSLWTAGKGYVGEASGSRITRYLTSVGYGGASAIDTGQSTMGADTAAEASILLTDALAVATTENGNLWFTGQGTVTFTSRTRRYLTTTAKWTFGEAETPYLGDVSYDHDPQLVYNDVLVRNASGISPEATDVASQSAYGPRTLSRDVNTQFDTEASDAASWLLATHKAPHQRIATLTLDPASNPGVWPVALGMEIGDRVTVKRRTSAFTMTADYFVESIAHRQDPQSWTVSLQCSPASLWKTPWLLNDATYSVLGSTTVLGY